MTSSEDSWWPTRLLIGAGVALILAGIGDAIRVRLTHPEKAAYYIFGHWFEAVWQFQVPLAALGVAALVTAWFIAPRR